MSDGTLERALADFVDSQNVDSEDIVEKAKEKSNLAIGSEIVSTTNPDAYRLVDGVEDVSGYWVIMKSGDEVVIDLGKEEVILIWNLLTIIVSYGVKDLEILVSMMEKILKHLLQELMNQLNIIEEKLKT